MTRIVVVGGLNMDLHLFGVRPSGGQAPLLAERYLAEPGGKGANVARAASRLGASVTLVGRVGDDEFGRDCVTAVASDGVDSGSVAATAGAPPALLPSSSGKVATGRCCSLQVPTTLSPGPTSNRPSDRSAKATS